MRRKATGTLTLHQGLLWKCQQVNESHPGESCCHVRLPPVRLFHLVGGGEEEEELVLQLGHINRS